MSGKAAKAVITERQQKILQQLSRATTVAYQLRQRATVILLAFEGGLIAIAVSLGVDRVGEQRQNPSSD